MFKRKLLCLLSKILNFITGGKFQPKCTDVRLGKFTVEALDILPDNYKDYGIEMMGIPELWKITKGEGIKVAVLDTGAYQHQNLKIAGGINLTNCSDKDYGDRQGHGTHTAGTIAARDVLNTGVTGVAPACDLYVVKILGDDGMGNLEWLANGLDWCVDNEMHVVSMSLGSPQGHPKLEAAVKRAYDAGLIIVCAAGNDGDPGQNSDDVNYPAKYPETIAVAAVDSAEQIAYFSSRGVEVAFSGPGVDIYSTYLNNTYAKLSGTSMATPHVSGFVALLQGKAFKETGKYLAPAEMRQVLIKYSEDLGDPGKDRDYGYGFIKYMAAQ